MLHIAPKIILRPMFCTLSSLLLLVFEAVFQVVEPYSTTGLTAPVVPASFFMMASFLVALASTASRYGFHVKRISRVTLRNVGVSTCDTGWLFDFSETFSFAVDSVKSVLSWLC